MNKLERWNPFKFKRPNQDVARNKPTTTQVARSPMDSFFHPAFMQRFWQDPFSAFEDFDRFFGDFSPRAFQPSVDVVDEGSNLRVAAELPGLRAEDVEVTFRENMLTIHGEKKHESETKEEGCYRTERYFGQFSRSIPLPAEVDIERAEAKFDNGVLTIRLPKTKEISTAKRIQISG